MKIWIIGKQGMLAEALQRHFTKKGIDFTSTSRKEVDVTDSKSVKEQLQSLEPTHIINASGYTAVDRAEEEKEKAYKLNVEAVEALGRLAKEKEVKLIHFSTDYVFDGSGSSPFSEEKEPAPLSVYGRTKYEGEKRLLAVYPKACVIRTSWLFGRSGNHFVRTMIKLMKQHENLRIVSDQKGRPTFADDLAKAAEHLLDHQGIYHFANEGETTWLEFAEEILKCLKEKGETIACQTIKPILTSEYGSPAKRPLFSVLKTDKYEKASKESPRHWQESLREYFELVPWH